MRLPLIVNDMALPKAEQIQPCLQIKAAKRFFKALLLLCFPFASSHVNAQIFMCKDASGRTITSDRPIPECSDRAVRELSHSGMLKREIEAPLTPEQKRQKQILEEQHKVEQAAAEEQKRQDQALKARYSNVLDIEAARKRSREPMLEKMRISNSTILVLEKVLKGAQEEKEFYKKKALPPSLTRKIEEAELAISTEKNAILNCATDIAKNDAIFDETLKRYQQITATNVNNTSAMPPTSAGVKR